jgi:DNA-binding protein H-NS
MSVEALMDLRKRVEARLVEHRAQLEEQLERMGSAITGPRVVRGGGSVLKGMKVPPKYRGPSGETWAGRGARPRWLVAAIKGGKKLDDFLIDKSARNGRRKRRSKRWPLVTMALIAQIALGVIIGGLTIALLVTGFFVWNGRQRNERLAVALFIAGAVIVVALLVVVVEASH